MPFTAAHPLAVAPLVRLRRWLALDATCLVIGSMAPDFEYFFRGEEVSTISHTVRGLLVWNLPITIVLAAIWHAWVKQGVLLVAPRGLAARAARPLASPMPRRVLALVGCAVSALVGAATHLVWDGITHARGYGPQHFRVLKHPVDVPVIGPMVLHRVVQHASTLVGLAGLAIIITVRLRRERPIALPDVPRLGPRLVFAAAILAGSAAVTANGVLVMHNTDPGSMVVAMLGGALAGIVVASLLVHRRAAMVLA